jgi:type IV fimbrial biogenesis protein FimT
LSNTSPLSRREFGASILELMAVVLITAILAASAMPMLHEQVAVRQIDSVARRFIAHAQFARGQALALGVTVHIAPLQGNLWDEGWLVSIQCPKGKLNTDCADRPWLSQGVIAPVYFKGGGRQFIDPHLGKRGIAFNAAGAAKTAHGGFVANRLILGHERHPQLERQLILGSGGRWRICDPRKDTKSCS